jgi:phosphoribosylformimino-5-aminoimidazole carboxamide ribotide isomerase
MEIIPVLDLKGRTVVRAHMGERDLYRPIETPLSTTSDPVEVARALLSIHPFGTLYIADLDAIEGSGDNHAALQRLRRAFPDVVLWVDNGIADVHRATAWLAAGWGHLVLGSETQADTALIRHFSDDARIVLSLDFRGSIFQGPPELLAEPMYWPRQVIVMTLARIGSGAGPDLERLSAIQTAAPGRLVYAAGGVRGVGDLAALKQRSIAGALVATCLHDGRLTGADIARLCVSESQS